MPQCVLEIGITNVLLIRGLAGGEFGDGILQRIAQAPLSDFAQQCSAIPGRQRQRSDRNVSELRHPSGDGTAGFAVRTRAKDYYAHPDASDSFLNSASLFVPNLASNSRVRRCSSMSASARNLHPQLMNRIGWYAPQMGYDPATPPATPRRPFDGTNCFSISFILRAALR